MRGLVPDHDLRMPASLDAALTLVNEGWRPMAGGTDLMVLFNAGKLPYRKLVSVRRLPELLEIEISDERVSIGAAVTYTQIRNHARCQEEFPLLCAAAGWTGSIANQNCGTLGGNIMNASPAADSAPALLVYDAELELISIHGSRRVRYATFHTGYKQMQIGEGELLCKIHLPRRHESWRQASRKVGPRRAQAISKVCFAAVASLRGTTVQDIRIALGSVAPMPFRCEKTEALLRGKSLSSKFIERACSALQDEVRPITDMRSTEEYRRAVARNLVRDFLQSCA